MKELKEEFAANNVRAEELLAEKKAASELQETLASNAEKEKAERHRVLDQADALAKQDLQEQEKLRLASRKAAEYKDKQISEMQHSL